MTDQDFSLAELLIVAAAEAWRDNGEVLATGITLIPRLAASLAKSTFNPALLMTDGENHFVSEPVPPGKRNGYAPKLEGWAPYDRTFNNLWSGKRHAMVAPVMIDRFGQTNISILGNHTEPKTAWLGARGFPGNSISHPNSYFFPSQNKRSFVAGEVDFVCGVGYNKARWMNGRKPIGLDLRLIITDLAVMDFLGPDHAIRVKYLHPGISFEQVQDNTGFDLLRAEDMSETPAPTQAQLDQIRNVLDPNGLRKTIIKGDPPGIRN